MAITTNKPKEVLGVIVELAQRSPYTIPTSETMEDWHYTVYSYFDEMRIRVIKDNLSDFYEGNINSMREGLDAYNRMLYHAETQRIFLYAESLLKEERMFLENISKGKPSRDFIALVAVQCRRQYKDASRCDVCKCLKEFVKKYIEKNEGFIFKPETLRKSKGSSKTTEKRKPDFCVLKSLGFDDAYILISSDDPNVFLRLLHHLHSHSCGEDCDLYKKTKERSAHIAVKQLTGLISEEQCINELTDDTGINQLDTCVKNIERCIEYLKSNKNDYKEDTLNNMAKSIRNCISAQLLRDFYKHEYNLSQEYAKLSWLLNCINAIRICGCVPMVLRSHITIARAKTLKADELTLPSVTVEYIARVQSRPGINDIKALFRVMDVSRDNRLIDADDFQLAEIVRRNKNRDNMRMASGESDHRIRFVDEELKKLISLYTEDFLDWRSGGREGLALPILHSSGYFVLSKDDERPITEDTIIQLRLIERMLKEDNQLAVLWAMEQSDRATKWFKYYRKQIEMEKYYFLHPLIDSLDRLHMQGCKKFFFTLI